METANAAQAVQIIELRKIWEHAPHNAFTDLVRFQDRWFCTFREGASHVSPNGALRVLTSADGVQWESAALLTSTTADLRDPKLSVTPDHRLMLNAAAAWHQPAEARHQSMVWFSSDGQQWSDATPVGDQDMWLWRVTWHKGVAYSLGYNTNLQRAQRFLRLYTSRDGTHFETLVSDLGIGGAHSPSESALLFLEDDTCLCLLRRDPTTAGNAAPGLLGMAQPPYTEWQWKDLGVQVGGPQLLRVPDGRIVAAVRLYDNKARTALCWLDVGEAKLTEFLSLPSGGDNSYAGLVWHEGLLWVSYYSSHEGKTSIYLAKVKLPP